jgi:hypothetical protein
VIGGDPFEKHESGPGKGLYKNKIISVFPSLEAIATGPFTHYDCWQAMCDSIGVTTDSEKGKALRAEGFGTSVYDDSILLDCDGRETDRISDIMDRVDCAAELLEEAFPGRKNLIKYSVNRPEVRDEIRRRGELYRISLPAFTKDEMLSAIQASRQQLETGVIYYYNAKNPHQRGTRYLTMIEILRLMQTPRVKWDQYAGEIIEYSGRVNRKGVPEVSMFNSNFRPEGGLKRIMKDFEKNLVDPLLNEYSVLPSF